MPLVIMLVGLLVWAHVAAVRACWRLLRAHPRTALSVLGLGVLGLAVLEYAAQDGHLVSSDRHAEPAPSLSRLCDASVAATSSSQPVRRSSWRKRAGATKEGAATEVSP